jgi:hypothetical protein
MYISAPAYKKLTTALSSSLAQIASGAAASLQFIHCVEGVREYAGTSSHRVHFCQLSGYTGAKVWMLSESPI